MVNDKFKPISGTQFETYQIALSALNRTIDDVLLIAEANKRNVPPEMVRKEITERYTIQPMRRPKFYATTKQHPQICRRRATRLPAIYNSRSRSDWNLHFPID
jgi:hypothetical protein